MARDDAARDSELGRFTRRSAPSLARANRGAVASVPADEPRTSPVAGRSAADCTTDVPAASAALPEGHDGTQ